MIEIKLSELDLELETTQLPDFSLSLEESSGEVALQGPIDFGLPEAEGFENWGFIDLDLLGFPYHGLSAYEVAVKNGFIGTEAEWLLSLKGEDGELGQAGQEAVIRAEAAASSASGDATAAAGFRDEAYTYSGVAGVHAVATQELYTQALAVRDETGQFAAATTIIYQQSEAILTDVQEEASAVQIMRVAAEVARAGAEASETRAAHSESSAAGSAASASETSNLAVEAANLANDKAAAAVLAESTATAAATDAMNEATAARKAQLIATAARDETNIIAQGVVLQVDEVHAAVTDAEAFAEAARLEKVAAEVARGGAETAASASVTAKDQASAFSDASRVQAEASSAQRILAETARGQSEAARTTAVSASQDAQGWRNQASDIYNLTVGLRDQTGVSAAAAVTARNQAETFADTSGQIYGALASRVDGVDVRLGNAEGNITSAMNAAVDAQGKVNLTVGLSLNANGYVSGTRASNNGTTANFTVVGDSFYLVNPNNGSPFRPFVVDGNQVTFNANVRINGALVINGSLYGQSLVTDTVQKAVVAYNPGTVALNNSTPTRIHGEWIDVEFADSPIKLDFNCWATFTHNAGGSFIAYVQLVRSRGIDGGEVLHTVPIYGSGMANDTWQGPVPMKTLDRPGETGLWHYYVQIFFNVSNMSTQSVVARYGEITELKNNRSTTLSTGTGSGTGVGAGGGTGGGGGTVDPGGGGIGGGGGDTPITIE